VERNERNIIGKDKLGWGFHHCDVKKAKRKHNGGEKRGLIPESTKKTNCQPSFLKRKLGSALLKETSVQKGKKGGRSKPKKLKTLNGNLLERKETLFTHELK